jgi:hypothetical protein
MPGQLHFRLKKPVFNWIKNTKKLVFDWIKNVLYRQWNWRRHIFRPNERLSLTVMCTYIVHKNITYIHLISTNIYIYLLQLIMNTHIES